LADFLFSEHSLLGFQQQQQHAERGLGGGNGGGGGGGGLTPKTPGSPNTVRSADTPLEAATTPQQHEDGGVNSGTICRTPSEDDRETPRSRGECNVRVYCIEIRLLVEKGPI
jgi:hypothetical protein